MITEHKDPSFVSSCDRLFISINKYRITTACITISVRFIVRSYLWAFSLLLIIDDNASDNRQPVSLLNFGVGNVQHCIGIQLSSGTLRQVW